MTRNVRRIETELIHAGELRIRGAVTTPVFQSAMFEFAGEESYYDLKYIRLNNTPNHVALHEKIARLERLGMWYLDEELRPTSEVERSRAERPRLVQRGLPRS